MRSYNNGFIKRRLYDHSNGRFTNEHLFKTKPLVIFEGLHPFYLLSMRNLFDLKIFLNPDPITISNRKIKRDIEERDSNAEKILAQIKKRKPDRERYISSQNSYADLIIEGSDEEKTLKLIFSETFNLEPLVDHFSRVDKLKVLHEYLGDGKQVVECQGEISTNEITNIASNLLSSLYDTGLLTDNWYSEHLGVIQLTIAYLIAERTNEVERFS